MTINWKRVVIAAVCSELILFILFLLTASFVSEPARRVINRLEWFGLLFLGGLWVARKIDSRFLLHGLLVGIIANILFFPLTPLIGLLLKPGPPRSGASTGLLISFILKMLAAAAGAYFGGIRRKKLLSAQDSKVSS
jgi:putative membrane protein (TIGR04086 family)